MQTNNEQFLTRQDFMNFSEQLNRIEQLYSTIEKMILEKQAPKKLVLTSAKEIGECLGVSEWQARHIMRHPSFPKSVTKRTGKYNRGKWSTEEVERFFKINKNKV